MQILAFDYVRSTMEILVQTRYGIMEIYNTSVGKSTIQHAIMHNRICRYSDFAKIYIMYIFPGILYFNIYITMGNLRMYKNVKENNFAIQQEDTIYNHSMIDMYYIATTILVTRGVWWFSLMSYSCDQRVYLVMGTLLIPHIKCVQYRNWFVTTE